MRSKLFLRSECVLKRIIVKLIRFAPNYQNNYKFCWEMLSVFNVPIYTIVKHSTIKSKEVSK